MSKKILKRSLVLGALMAFVITGSAWAAEINNRTYSGESNYTQGGAVNLSSGEWSVNNSKFYDNHPIEDSRISTSKGGAIFINNIAVALEGNEFVNNSSSYWGGAIALNGTSADVTLSGSNVFKGNISAGGGAIAFYDGTLNFGDKASNGIGCYTLFENNIATNSANERFGGGAIDFDWKKGGNLNFYSDVDFKNNYATWDGGAISNRAASGKINFIKGTATFTGNKAGVTLNTDTDGNVAVAGGTENDIYNKGTINIERDATVNLDGGINGTGTVNINGGTLNGKVVGNAVAMDSGIWDLFGKSEVSALSGNGTLKVDLTTGEQVKVLSANSAAINASDDFSEIDIDHGGVVGVDVEQGVTNFYNTLVDSAGESLIKDRNIGDIFLQAAVETDGEGNFVSTTVKPGDKFIIDSENVKVNGNLEAESITVGGVVLEESLEGKADKADLDAEAKTRETKDNELLEKINQIDGGSSEAIKTINQRLDRTNAKINKVGAGAAALAALHPLEYDLDDKLTFSAGMGNYAGENAAALGAFYRPNEKIMVSLGGTMGNGENMVNLGLSIGLDKANGLAKLSKKELIQKVNAVEAENDALEDRVAKLEALVAQLANK